MPYTMLKDTTQLNPSKIERITVLRDSAAVAIYGQAGKNGVVLVETKVAANRKDSLAKANKPQYGVEVMPVFPGGDEGLMAFIRKNLHYPSSEAFRNIEGRTTIRFVISKTGKLTDITVVRSLSPGCDAEAVRVVRMMPDWKPGTQKGVPVDVYYTLPVVFRMVR
jgi:protein TonB